MTKFTSHWIQICSNCKYSNSSGQISICNDSKSAKPRNGVPTVDQTEILALTFALTWRHLSSDRCISWVFWCWSRRRTVSHWGGILRTAPPVGLLARSPAWRSAGSRSPRVRRRWPLTVAYRDYRFCFVPATKENQIRNALRFKKWTKCFLLMGIQAFD